MDVIYEDNHLLVLRKPAGVLVQGDRTGDISLLAMAKEYIKEKYQKPGEVYLGLVHRLDRPVSGVVVLARTSKAASRLSEQFKKREIRKIYWALVEGKVPETGIFHDQVRRGGHRSRVLEDTEEGQSARLNYRLCKYTGGISWVEIDLGTGRHHQIRAQFAHRGFPLLGDFRYGSHIKFPERSIALLARSITVSHPISHEEMTFTAEPEDYWQPQFRAK